MSERALVVNDDGVHAPGIRHLAEVAVGAGLDVVVAAPTVPEWSTAWPVLRPRLMPDNNNAGGGPKAPRDAMSAMNAGAASTP